MVLASTASKRHQYASGRQIMENFGRLPNNYLIGIEVVRQ